MCTGLYVGKKVSLSGRAIIARSADSAKNMDNLATIKIVESKSNQTGNYICAVDSELKYPLPNNTYKYISMPSIPNKTRGSVASYTANEMGLYVTSSVTASTCKQILEADPLTKNGICESVIPEILGSSCKNATEAISLVEKLMKEFGSQGCENIMIADKDSAWVVELYSGHQWAAYKMPEDKVSVYGNAFHLTTEYSSCSKAEFRHSENLFELPKQLGSAVYIDGKMSICESYEGEGRYSRYASLRTYFGHRLLAPSTAGKYEETIHKPMFYEPDKKVSLQDVFELYRNRYEGSEFCPEENGTDDQRLIASEATYNVGVAEIYEDLPPEASVVVWGCMGSPIGSVFLPYSNLMTECAESYRFIDLDSKIWRCKPLPKDDNNRDKKYNEKIASCNFKKLSALTATNMKQYKPGVHEYWSKKEVALIKDFENKYIELLKEYKTNQETAIKNLNNYIIKLQEKSEAEAKAMFDELIWFIMTYIETFQYSFSQETHEFTRKETKLFMPTMCFLDNYL